MKPVPRVERDRKEELYGKAAGSMSKFSTEQFSDTIFEE